MRFHRHNMKILATIALALSLTGCAGLFTPPLPTEIVVASAPKPDAKPVDVKPLCEKVKNLSPAESKALADLLAGLDPKDPLIGVLADYKRMRDEARACLNFK